MDDQHDSLCRQQYWTGSDCFDCRLIARVRSDEREQWTMMLKERTEERDEARHDAQAARAGHRVSVMAYLDAEAVAARLVEVICDDEHDIQALLIARRRYMQASRAASDEAVRLTDDLDAARAEVAALREQLGRAVDEEARS